MKLHEGIMAESKFLTAIAKAVEQAEKDGMDQAAIAAALLRASESVDAADGE
jgi:hypothetical protein